jgi:hypothetical protein
LILTTFASSVLTPRLVTPGTASLITTLFAPTVTIGGNVVVTPGTLALLLTLFAPTVTVAVGVSKTVNQRRLPILGVS